MFDISIEQKVLAKALEYLEPTVGKASMLGENCISMKTTGLGSIEMYTTNSIEFTKLEAIVSFGGNTQEQSPYVDFKRFKAIINSIPENEIVSIKSNVNDLLINFSLKKTPVKLVGCINGMIPLINISSNTAQVTVPRLLVKNAIDNVSSIIVDTTSTPIYNCMRIFTSNNDVEFTALDINNKRTFYMSGQATSNNSDNTILVEVSKLKKSLKIFEDFNELVFSMTSNIIEIKGSDPVTNTVNQGMIDNISYYARRINGVFPNNIKNSYFPAPVEFAEIPVEELKNSFARVKAIEDQNTNGQINFEIRENKCVISMNSSYGDIEDEITLNNSVSKPFKAIFKYGSLSDIMKVISENILKIGPLPAHPMNYVVESKNNLNNNDIMFTISGMVGQQAQP